MRVIRRSDMSPRVEMMPLIDVVFLLLTFFIYSLVLMVRAQVLPITLTPLGGEGTSDRTPVAMRTLTIDSRGELYLDRQAITLEQLGEAAASMASDPQRPRLLIALSEESERDRSAVILRVLGRAQAAGLTRVGLVDPRSGSPPADPSDSSAPSATPQPRTP